jgi:transposase
MEPHNDPGGTDEDFPLVPLRQNHVRKRGEETKDDHTYKRNKTDGSGHKYPWWYDEHVQQTMDHIPQPPTYTEKGKYISSNIKNKAGRAADDNARQLHTSSTHKQSYVNLHSWLGYRRTTLNDKHKIRLDDYDETLHVKPTEKTGKIMSTKRSKKTIDHETQKLLSFKMRVRLTEKAKTVAHRIFGVQRLAYNDALSYLQTDEDMLNRAGVVVKEDGSINFSVDRYNTPKWTSVKMYLLNQQKRFATTPIPKKLLPLFDQKTCPYGVKASSIHSLCAAINSTKESLKAKNEKVMQDRTNGIYRKSKGAVVKKDFNVKPRLKVDLTQSFNIDVAGKPSRSVQWDKESREIYVYPRSFTKGSIVAWNKRDFKKWLALQQDPAKDHSNYQATFKYEAPGYYYIIMRYVATKKERKSHLAQVAALDPGVRTFQTTYDSRGNTMEFGVGSIHHVSSLALQIDKLKSELDTGERMKEKMASECSFSSPHKARQYRQNYRRGIRHRIRHKQMQIKNLLADVHWKVANKLVDKYCHILLPTFQVSNMVMKKTKMIKGRVLSKQTVNDMLNWRHYQFREKLKHKASMICDDECEVHDVAEPWTSKACGSCGRLHHALGGAKEFVCPYCGHRADRDLNAARNIFIMNVEKCVGRRILPPRGL